MVGCIQQFIVSRHRATVIKLQVESYNATKTSGFSNVTQIDPARYHQVHMRIKNKFEMKKQLLAIIRILLEFSANDSPSNL